MRDRRPVGIGNRRSTRPGGGTGFVTTPEDLRHVVADALARGDEGPSLGGGASGGGGQRLGGPGGGGGARAFGGAGGGGTRTLGGPSGGAGRALGGPGGGGPGQAWATGTLAPYGETARGLAPYDGASPYDQDVAARGPYGGRSGRAPRGRETAVRTPYDGASHAFVGYDETTSQELVPYGGPGRDRTGRGVAPRGRVPRGRGGSLQPAPRHAVHAGATSALARRVEGAGMPEGVAQHLIAAYAGLPPAVARHLIASDPRVAETLARRMAPDPRAATIAPPRTPLPRRTTPRRRTRPVEDLLPRDPFLDDVVAPRPAPTHRPVDRARVRPVDRVVEPAVRPADQFVEPAVRPVEPFVDPAHPFLDDEVAPAPPLRRPAEDVLADLLPADPFLDEVVARRREPVASPVPEEQPFEDEGVRETDGEALPLGELLLRDAGVSRAALGTALDAQAREGGLLGLHLLLAGAVTRRGLYGALATQWGAPLVDLVAVAPDRALLRGQSPAEVLERGWIPWRRKGDEVVVATCVRPDEALRDEASAVLGGVPVTFRTTTDWDVSQAIQTAFRDELLYTAGAQLAEEREAESARAGLRRWQLVAPLALLGVIGIGLGLSTALCIAILFATANVIFLGNVLFKVVAGVRAPWRIAATRRWNDEIARTRVERGLPPVWPVRTPDHDLPIYTILVPAYGEANVIGKLIANLDELDYPKSKLDVMVLMEADDEETVEAAKRMNPPEYVRLVVVPAGAPQTKPRACNYGLELARGEYVVIYDAEDRPDPDQLRKAVAAFQTDRFEREHLGAEQAPLVCVQAALNYFNADYNVLTRMFSVEYAHWFDAMLPGLDGTKLPTPLGGTSNHFDTAALRELGAWDPWNVTEDADLGIRAVAHGYRVGSIQSTTWEEACAEVPAWIRQRTRWIKGYMMTAAVVARHPFTWSRRNGAGGVLTMVGLIGGTPLAFMLYPAILGFTIVTYIGTRSGSLGFPDWLLTAGAINMVGANLAMIVAGAIAGWRRYSWRIGAFALLNPFYWILHSIAAWRAALQMVTSPHHWEKTPHGLSEDYEDSFDGGSGG